MTATRRKPKTIRVRVENGLITGKAPPGLPDGEHDLCLLDDEAELSETELARLNDALERGYEAVKAGRTRPARGTRSGGRS
jgi:hypothetical protein